MSALQMLPKILCQVQALYSYHSEDHTSLSFEKGDQIDVLAKLDSGWWDGWSNGRRGWFPSNYVQVRSEGMRPYSRLPDQPLPLNPKQQHYIMDLNRRVSSVYSSSSSEVSRNNTNLPDGWTIQMTDDRNTWFLHNEHTGESVNQQSSLVSTADTDKNIIIPERNYRKSSFHSDKVDQVDYKPATVTSKEIMNSWVERKTPQGRPYFCNLITQETTWDYDEINSETGHLKKTQQNEEEYDKSKSKDDCPNKKGSETVLEQPVVEELTWNKLATDIAFAIHQLTLSSQKGQQTDLHSKTAKIVETVRLMLYASRFMEKDSALMQNPLFREPRRAVMSSLSKLVLSSKLCVEHAEFASSVSALFQKIQRDANDVLVAVRNFVTVCQQRNISINYVSPRLLDNLSQLPYEPSATCITPTSPTIATVNKIGNGATGNISIAPINKRSMSNSGVETNNSLVQKAKFLLNQDLVSSLQAYSHQIFGSTEKLSMITSIVLEKAGKGNKAMVEEERANVVSMFRILSSQVSQYILVLEDISLENINSLYIPSIANYRVSRQNLYTSIGHLFGAIQTLTDIQVGVAEAVHTIDQSIASVEDAVQSIEQSVVAMVNERKRTMTMSPDDYITISPSVSSIVPSKNSTNTSFIDSNIDQQSEITYSTNPSLRSQEDILDSDSSEFGGNFRRTLFGGTFGSGASNLKNDVAYRGRQQSIRTEDRSLDSNDTGGSESRPNDIAYNSDSSVKGGTLAALVERLTVHNTLDTNFIATFLLTYRSFCTTEEFVSLLEARYNVLPPERLTPEQLERWIERKQKLIRLRVFNVLKNWLENYYVDEDEYLLSRIEHFTDTNIRDSSSFAANQLLKLIRKRIELSARGEMKKIVPNPISGPDPIYPKNVLSIQLLETDPVEMARQLSIMDFKLYSSIRPIECLGKVWSRDGEDGFVAMNIKKSIQYCNRLTAWVTDSILSYDEAKKRTIVIKYWVQVANHCRADNNFNTCMAILSAFDNSAVGRLKKTWMMSNRNTTQSLAHIRKLMGSNRNFTEYREIIHSVNPPCIPFLGIYLQDLTFIEDGNPDYLRTSKGLINFAKRQKTAEVIRELKQFQSFAYNYHTIPEFQEFIKSKLDESRDVEKMYERSLKLEPRITEPSAPVGNLLTLVI